MKLIALDDGHGMETSGKRTPPITELNNRAIKENEFNRAVVAYLDRELKRCGFKTLLVAPTDKDTTLSQRISLANSQKADAYISIHYNASDGKFNASDPEGIEIHVYPGAKDSKKLAECILKYLVQGTTQKNRGIKESNFQVLRETKMTAILSENGFMDNKKEAMLMINTDFQKEVAREHAQGICDYFGIKYVKEKEVQKMEKTSIIGKSECTADQLEAYLLSKNPNPKINMPVKDFCKLWIKEGEIEGVRGDIAFCQALHETGFFKYGGQVLPEQNNYGGIGATNNSPIGKGAWFDSPQIGVRANIQHLKAYANKENLKQECVDPRFSLVTRGIAPTLEDLAGKWAYPGYDKNKYVSLESAIKSKETYGHFILDKFEEMKKIKTTSSRDIVKQKAGFDDNTMKFLDGYKFSDAMYEKLAATMK